jgi:hypothetical protein
MAWREDHRRGANGEQFRTVAGLAINAALAGYGKGTGSGRSVRQPKLDKSLLFFVQRIRTVGGRYQPCSLRGAKAADNFGLPQLVVRVSDQLIQFDIAIVVKELVVPN